MSMFTPAASYFQKSITIFSDVQGTKTQIKDRLRNFEWSATIERTISAPSDAEPTIPATVVVFTCPAGENLSKGLEAVQEYAKAHRYEITVSNLEQIEGAYNHTCVNIGTATKVPPQYLRTSSSTEIGGAGFFSATSMTTFVHNVSDAIKSSPRSARSAISSRITGASAPTPRVIFVYGPTALKVGVSHDMTKEEVFAELANKFELPAKITRLVDHKDGVGYDGCGKDFRDDDVVGIETAAGAIRHTHEIWTRR